MFKTKEKNFYLEEKTKKFNEIYERNNLNTLTYSTTDSFLKKEISLIFDNTIKMDEMLQEQRKNRK